MCKGWMKKGQLENVWIDVHLEEEEEEEEKEDLEIRGCRYFEHYFVFFCHGRSKSSVEFRDAM